MLKVYIAAPYELRTQACRLMDELAGRCLAQVTSSWLWFDDSPTHASAMADLADLDRADALVLLNGAEWAAKGTGGRHVEFGYALAKGKPVIVVGARTNIFHHLCNVRVVTLDGLYAELALVEREIPAA